MEKRNLLWYNTPAEIWTDALPVGNGKLGVMVYGRALNEMIQIDESTFWSGEASVNHNNRQDTKEVLKSLRDLLAENKIEEADQEGHNFIGIKNNYGTNMPTGNLLLTLKNVAPNSSVKDFKRTLDLETAIAETTFQIEGTHYHREVLASNPHQVFAVSFYSDENTFFDIDIRYEGIENDVGIIGEEDGEYCIEGNAFETLHSDGKKGVHLVGRICLITDGSNSQQNGTISLKQATHFVLFAALETNMFQKNPAELCKRLVKEASFDGYDKVKKKHISDFANLYHRMDLWIGDHTEYADLSTEQRLENASNGKEDLGLLSLLFHYGRYLLITGSRENSPLPTHMGGIWNDNLYNKQDSTQDMHIDVNVQMQYWLANACQLSECSMPLFHWIQNCLVPSGRITAKEAYGAEGWVAHIVSNPWGYTSLGWSYNWGVFALGGVWAALEMWSYYDYTRDLAFLKETAYPVLKEAAQFCLSYLFSIEGCEYLMAGPSYSPENMFSYQGKGYFLSLSTTCDILLIREIFTVVLKGANELKLEEDKVLNDIREAIPKLPPYQIGHWGNLKEWFMDFEEHIPGHRHTSHLLGIYPYWQIEADRDKELAEAVRVSLEGRLKKWESTSWGIALSIGTFARLFDADAAYERLKVNFRTQMRKNLFPIMGDVNDMWRGAWELDGNTGVTAAICEMLVQSHNDKIHLLPALPSTWENGYIKGLALRGGNQLNLTWENHNLTEAVLLVKLNGIYQIRYKDRVIALDAETGLSYSLVPLFNE